MTDLDVLGPRTERIALNPGADPTDHVPPETIYERRTGWQVIDLGEIWRYRELLFFLVWRDVKVRYKQTLLGASWAVVQPLMLMVAFTVFLSKLGGTTGTTPYPVFVLTGLLPWVFFASAMNGAGNSVVGSERLITKVYFPRLLVPFSAVGASVVDFAVSLGLMAVVLAWYRIAPGAGAALTPLVFGLILMMALGIGTFLAALNVAYRDFKAVIPFLTQFLMFATPTIYAEPAQASPLVLWLNPLAALIASFRASLLGEPISWGPLGSAAFLSVAACVIGCLYFRKTERSFADLI